jgi:hypothetical protein
MKLGDFVHKYVGDRVSDIDARLLVFPEGLPLLLCPGHAGSVFHFPPLSVCLFLLLRAHVHM